MKVIIEDGLTVGGKSLREIDEATGHARAYDFIFELVKTEDITVLDVRKIRKLFYEKIDSDNAGEYRKQKVFISGMDVTLRKRNTNPPYHATF
jgi:Fic family protein